MPSAGAKRAPSTTTDLPCCSVRSGAVLYSRNRLNVARLLCYLSFLNRICGFSNTEADGKSLEEESILPTLGNDDLVRTVRRRSDGRNRKDVPRKFLRRAATDAGIIRPAVGGR